MFDVVPTGRDLQKVTGNSPVSKEKIMLKYTIKGTTFNTCKYSLRSGDPTIQVNLDLKQVLGVYRGDGSYFSEGGFMGF